eukprot:scaffold2046_cov64-Cylindrotheca_fusiformis.AAC.2
MVVERNCPPEDSDRNVSKPEVIVPTLYEFQTRVTKLVPNLYTRHSHVQGCKILQPVTAPPVPMAIPDPRH